MPAPGYLSVTSHAHVGVVNYSHLNLSMVFCAPNKVWEYTGFGTPCLCADLPGLALSVGAAGAGVCCDMSDQASIGTGLEELHGRWSAASQAATRFFDAIDCRDIVARVVEGASS